MMVMKDGKGVRGQGARPPTTIVTAAVLAAMVLAMTAGVASAQMRGTTARRTSSGQLNTQTRQYRNKTMLGEATIETDSETRSLVVVADDETSREIAKLVEQLDQPKPQVLIKVLFLEVTHNNSMDIGFEGKHASAGGIVNEGVVETAWGIAQELEGGFWNLKADDWEATFRAMAESGKLEVLSRPSILARNNQEAVIVVGEEIPLITNSRVTDNGQTINTIQYTEVGIILRVTPFITSEELVEMIVAPEISALSDQTVPISETVRSPVINKRSAETVVVTPHGKTVVIGGLMENQKTESVRKIPLLGDIPIIGQLFRRNVTDSVKKELVIFLTPYIVGFPGELEALSKQELSQTRLVREATADPDVRRRFLEGRGEDDAEEDPEAAVTPEDGDAAGDDAATLRSVHRMAGEGEAVNDGGQ